MSLVKFPCTAVANADYCRAYDQPLVAAAGSALIPLQRDAEYPGWVWCADDQGVAAWVPESWLIQKDDYFVLVRDYNSIELNLQAGERLTLLAEESGWYLALRDGGERGWAPVSCLEIDKPS